MLIKNALEDFESARKNAPPPFTQFDLARMSYEELVNWHADTSAVIASLLIPVLTEEARSKEELIEAYQADTLEVIDKYLDWKEVSETLEISEPKARYSWQLRFLLRKIYLELPNLSFILLVLAFHNAELMSGNCDLSAKAQETEEVFAPLAKMLGLWRLSRAWLDRSAAILAPKEYNKMLIDLGYSQASSESELKKEFLEVCVNYQELSSLQLTSDQKMEMLGKKLFLEKGQAFFAIEERLQRLFLKNAIWPKPRILPIRQLPGINLRRTSRPSSKEESEEELRNRLSVRILCQTSDDCYRILGYVHSLGIPVTSKYSDRFEDFIAKPQINGYRALHTTILYKEQTERRSRLVNFRILTPEMHRLNEGGYIVARTNSRYNASEAWWNNDDSLNQKLLRESKIDLNFTGKDFIRRNNMGSQSSPLYVFTPDGEVIFIESNSTALDFAYKIHTQLGDHIGSVEVNSAPAPYHRLLHNGDIVHIQFDPDSPGPNLAFLNIARTQYALTKIRRGLIKKASAIHRGRKIIEEKLIKVLQFYQQEKHYVLPLTSGRLDSYLQRIKELRKLSSIDDLYDEIVNGDISPINIVNRLIAEELSATLVDLQGNYPSAPPHRIFLCDQCHPVPGDRIAVYERRTGTSTYGLVIHVQGCKSTPNKEPATFEWPQPHPAERMLFHLDILGHDRYRLVAEILDVIYDEPGVYLYKIDAEANEETKQAKLNLVIEISSLEQLSKLQSKLETIRNVTQTFSYPSSTSQRLSIKNSSYEQFSNPYFFQAVYEASMFYGRVKETNELLRWLAEPLPTRLAVLHGQRRVGKTSLVKFLSRVAIPKSPYSQTVIPIFIDFQGLSYFGAADIAGLIMNTVYQTIQKSLPTIKTLEPPMQWLNRGLHEALDLVRGKRILIIMDELNVLLDHARTAAVDLAIFSNLRWVMNENRLINWLLVVQDVYYHDPAYWGVVGTILQQAMPIHLPNLTSKEARKLIIEPAKSADLSFEGTVPNRIINLTDRNPFFVQVLCYYLVDYVKRQNRKQITPYDLEYATDLVLSESQTYFDHILNITAQGCERKNRII
ncbi:MAG: TGS domain-containing protein [Anaerolineales bacterium]